MPLTLSGTPAINGLNLPTDTFVPGTVLLNTTTFSAVSTVSVNNVFTSTYENYRVTIWITGSTVGSIYARLRSGGVDNSSANYDNSSWRFSANNTSGVQYSGTVNEYRWASMDATGSPSGGAFEFMSPAIASRYTVATFDGNEPISGTALTDRVIGSHQYMAATAFDGFTIYPTTGTITGNLRIYGYRN